MADADAEQPSGDASSSRSWSDADYITSLKHLQELQSQIDSLRAALPSLIAPLTTPPNPSPLSTVSPSNVYAEFASLAVQAMKDVKTLRELWESEETKRIFQHADESLEAGADVEWEFVNKGRWGEIPEDEAAKDVEMKNDEPPQDFDDAKESQETSG